VALVTVARAQPAERPLAPVRDILPAVSVVVVVVVVAHIAAVVDSLPVVVDSPVVVAAWADKPAIVLVVALGDKQVVAVARPIAVAREQSEQSEQLAVASAQAVPPAVETVAHLVVLA